MRALVRSLLLVTTLLAAGCLGSGADPSLPPAEVAPAPAALEVALAPTECELGLLIFLVPFEQAQRHLPDGFAARDAQGVLGTPAPTGKGAVVLSNLVCDSSALDAGYGVGELLIVVEAPKVEAQLKPTTLDYYAPALHVAEGPLRDLARQAGFPPIEGEMALDVELSPAAGTAVGDLRDGGETVWEFDITGATPITASALERIWHAAPGGLAFLENEYTNKALLGSAECALGGIAAEVVGVGSCAAGEVVGAVVPPQSWTARLVTLPGVHAQ